MYLPAGVPSPTPNPAPFLPKKVQESSSGCEMVSRGRSHTSSPKLRNPLLNTAERRGRGVASSMSFRSSCTSQEEGPVHQKDTGLLWGSKCAWLQLNYCFAPPSWMEPQLSELKLRITLPENVVKVDGSNGYGPGVRSIVGPSRSISLRRLVRRLSGLKQRLFGRDNSMAG